MGDLNVISFNAARCIGSEGSGSDTQATDVGTSMGQLASSLGLMICNAAQHSLGHEDAAAFIDFLNKDPSDF
eukprot:8770933-Karenia_brevis.AAC.1